MVLTKSQVKSFFEDATQMAILNATVTCLGSEGILRPEDLSEVTGDTMKQIVADLRADTTDYVLWAKSHRQILVAADEIRYYKETRRALTAENIQWIPVIKSFESQWKALLEKKACDDPETPKISKALPLISWTKSFCD